MMQARSEFEAFKQMMEQTAGVKQGDADEICAGCRYYRADFMYRFCQFTECPYIKGFKTYRERYYK